MQSDLAQRYATELAVLQSRGFVDQRKNLKLLKKTNGNVEVIVNFLAAKNALHSALAAQKRSKKETKETLKSLKKLHFGEDDDAEKKAKKALKKEFKEAKKDHKKRVHKEEKLEKKEKKRFKKEEKKAYKAACKAKEDTEEPKVLPEKIKTVYLDGNNMLFVTSAIRNACLRSKMRDGEHLLESMARAWTSATPQLTRCVLLFDDTPTHVSEDRFQVVSSRPSYPTADDELLDRATTASSEEKENICVFTSDRALGESLKNAGVTVIKSKRWFKMAAAAMPVEGADNVDTWAEKWISKNVNKN